MVMNMETRQAIKFVVKLSERKKIFQIRIEHIQECKTVKLKEEVKIQNILNSEKWLTKHLLYFKNGMLYDTESQTGKTWSGKKIFQVLRKCDLGAVSESLPKPCQ